MMSSEAVNIAVNIVRRVLKAFSPKIYLFGSRAEKKEHFASDIDLAVSSTFNIPDAMFSETREQLEQSHLLYSVDLIDLSKTDRKFKKAILKKGILWND